MKVIQIAHNAVNARLYNADKGTMVRVANLLSYYVDGAEHSEAFKTHRWDGRSSFFDFKSQTFPAGFVHAVHSNLTKAGLQVQIVRKPLPAPLGPENPKVDDFPDDPNYDYHMETVRRLLRHGQMIAQVATGGGKSRIAKLATARINRMTLFLTTRGVLMYQMRDAYREMGRNPGVLGDSEWTPRNGINVGMVQTLAARLEKKTIDSEIERVMALRLNKEARELEALEKDLKKKRTPLPKRQIQLDALREKLRRERPNPKDLAARIEDSVREHEIRRQKTIKLLEMVEFIILEEAHEAGGNSFYEITRYCKNAHYRLSLTATPFMRDDEESNMRLMACSGPIGIKISEKMLIDRGILAKPYFKYVELPKPAKLFRGDAWQRAYKEGIVENEYRNRHIVWEAKRAADLGMPVMVLVQREQHGKLLKQLLREQGVLAEFIFGKHEQDERKAALTRLGSGITQVLIGSTILDVGVDVPAVGMVILAGGGKAEVAARQRIGRGLRRKKSGPNVALIVDFADKHNIYLSDHAKQRRQIVEKTPGFVEGVLPPDQDFDFVELGLAA